MIHLVTTLGIKSLLRYSCNTNTCKVAADTFVIMILCITNVARSATVTVINNSTLLLFKYNNDNQNTTPVRNSCMCHSKVLGSRHPCKRNLGGSYCQMLNIKIISRVQIVFQPKNTNIIQLPPLSNESSIKANLLQPGRTPLPETCVARNMTSRTAHARKTAIFAR